jgi:alpha-mannosidase
MKNTVLHMIGNAHIDPVWLWQWPEGYQEVLATFRSALDRMKEYEDFCFTASSRAFYEWVEQANPLMFEEIRARVTEGRWEIVGGCGSSPTAHPRAIILSAKRCMDSATFVRNSATARGYNPDSFGHHGMLAPAAQEEWSGLLCLPTARTS